MCLYATLSFAKARELLSILIFFTKFFLYSQIYKYIYFINDNALLRVCRYKYMDYMVYTYICASNSYFLLFLSMCACVWRLWEHLWKQNPLIYYIYIFIRIRWLNLVNELEKYNAYIHKVLVSEFHEYLESTKGER